MVVVMLPEIMSFSTVSWANFNRRGNFDPPWYFLQFHFFYGCKIRYADLVFFPPISKH